jgi:Ca2+-binding EF-hand superfamily protein
MDADGDGVITRAEWRGSERSFEVHDWNHDGVLSGEEVRAAGRRTSGWPQDPNDEDGRFSEWTPDRFRELDHDRNGRITRDEWHFDAETFRRVDRDGDGSLSRNEFLGLEADDDRDDRFDYLDANHDGRITGEEWHADPVQFGSLDRDRNGVLTRDEMGADDAPRDLFASLDVNRDERVTLDEWHWSRQAFTRRDTDGDGSLSRRELSTLSGTPRAYSSQSEAYRAGGERGHADGVKAGREDRQHNNWDLSGQRELEQADAGYAPALGSRADYQEGYREGFRRGYGEGFGPRP